MGRAAGPNAPTQPLPASYPTWALPHPHSFQQHPLPIPLHPSPALFPLPLPLLSHHTATSLLIIHPQVPSHLFHQGPIHRIFSDSLNTPPSHPDPNHSVLGAPQGAGPASPCITRHGIPWSLLPAKIWHLQLQDHCTIFNPASPAATKA